MKFFDSMKIRKKILFSFMLFIFVMLLAVVSIFLGFFGISQSNLIKMFKMILIFLPIFGISTFLFSLFINKNIVKPINELKDISVKIADGDLRVSVNDDLVSLKDEIGDVANSFDSMINNISLLITDITINASLSASESEELSASTEEINSSVEQISSTIQHVAQGAQKVSGNALDAQNASNKTKDSAAVGNKAARSVSEKMNMISASTKDSADTIKHLGEKSKEIKDIVTTINTIAEKTGLLSLNATIEAARAGEAGKGFAVVADEVRKLSEQSSESAKNITNMIGEILKEITDAVGSMDKNTLEVDEGAMIVQEALTSFQTIPELAEKVDESLITMSAVAEENAAGSEEVSSSIQEVNASMQQVTSSAQSLSKNASHLSQLVSKFKIKDVGSQRFGYRSMKDVEKKTDSK